MVVSLVSRVLVFSGVSMLFTGFYASKAGRKSQGIGPRSQRWESLRQLLSEQLAVIHEGFGPRKITEEEFVAEVEKHPSEVEAELRRKGFTRNPLSRVKTLNGSSEHGSWARRERPLSKRQLHIMLFSSEKGTAIYAHEEYSSMHPIYGYEHFHGIDQRMEKGVKAAKEVLENISLN